MFFHRFMGFTQIEEGRAEKIFDRINRIYTETEADVLPQIFTDGHRFSEGSVGEGP